MLSESTRKWTFVGVFSTVSARDGLSDAEVFAWNRDEQTLADGDEPDRDGALLDVTSGRGNNPDQAYLKFGICRAGGQRS